MEQDYAVAVVGAGLSGLVAARELTRRGIDVVVLESADRVGGRALTETTELGSHVDLGGQWIGHDHRRLIALADEFGLTRYSMHTTPMPAVIDGSRWLSAATPAVLLGAAVLAGVEAVAAVGTPARWNTVTVASSLRRLPGRTTRRLLEVLALISWTGDLERMSVHAMARMIRQQGGLRTAMATKGGAQEALLVEGVGGLAERLAAELGSRVRTGQRVTSIVRDEHGVTLHAPAGEIRAAKVIVTAPPPMAGRIEHQPPLPAARAALERNTYMGSVYKALAVYGRPFWRSRSGAEFIVLDNPGRAVFDTSPPDGPGHLCMLIGGPEAHRLDRLDVDTRRRTLLGPLAAHLGDDVLNPAGWHEKSWHRDVHAGGGYTALPAAGTTEGLLPAAHTPVGHVHWAGTEVADDHAGYFEGAIESGMRAAREVAETIAG